MKNLSQLTDSQLIGARYIYCGRCYSIKNERQVYVFRRRIHWSGRFCILRPTDVNYHIACGMLNLRDAFPEVVLMTCDCGGGLMEIVLTSSVLKNIKF